MLEYPWPLLYRCQEGKSSCAGYIPPETWRKQRWQPQGVPQGIRSPTQWPEDIFSLGVVFFQLMTARVPRSGPDRIQGIFQEGAKTVQARSLYVCLVS